MKLSPLIALALCACGPPAPARLPTPPPPALPAPGPDQLVGEGHGYTAHEAELDARRAVAEQLRARITSRTEAAWQEVDGVVDQRAETRTASEAFFEHAELIHTLGIVPAEGGFRARAVLDRDQAARVFRQQIQEDDARLAQLAVALEAGLASLDTAALLRPGPRLIREHQRDAAALLQALGRPTTLSWPPHLAALSTRLAAARRRTVIRLQVAGALPADLREAVVAAWVQLFQERGCALVEAPHTPPPDGVPAADAVLTVMGRRHQEKGLEWRYLGVDLRIEDARTRHPVFLASGLPDTAHGGGLSEVQADKAALRRLGEVLPERFGAQLAGLDCR
ncbi:MAG: hypothetical protein R3F60_33995 [bacterium]